MLNGNITATEITLNQRGLLIWTIVVSLLILVCLGSFGFMVEAGFVEIIADLPELITSGLGLDPQIFADVNLYHAGLVMLYGLLLTSIYAMMLAGKMVSKEVDLGTVEFLYTKPVTRTAVLISKALSFLVLLTILWIAIYLVSTALGIFWVAPGMYDPEAQFIAHLAGYFACLASGGLAFALAPLYNRIRATTLLAIGLGFAFFLFNSLASMYEGLDFLKYLSIYYYADMTGAANGEPFLAGMIVLPAVFVAGVIIGAVLLNRRELFA